MKIIKILTFFATGTILVTKYVIGHNERKEHKLILSQLKSNKDIIKAEDPEKTGSRFIKHPKSKKLSIDGEIRWDVRADGLMKIQLDNNNLIVPSNQDKQFRYYFHERGHLESKDKGHFQKEKACGYDICHCLRRELEAELYFMKISKKIGKKLEKADLSKNRRGIQRECKKCLEIINQRKCPGEEREKIKKCLRAIGEKND